MPAAAGNRGKYAAMAVLMNQVSVNTHVSAASGR